MSKSPISDEDLFVGLQKLKQQLILHRVIVRDLTGSNICCKILKNNSIELMVIDSVGHRNFIPLCDWSRSFARNKIEHIID
jgi:hypothetical protein